jgi:pimeloyl-ACP methyl ester carboxylesterase
MKLAYQDAPSAGPGVPAVVLHREGMTSIDGPMGVALASTGVGRVVAPYGHYAYYPSGMEVGGICWYRVLPGFTGTDPISLATAVVQVCDLLDDLDLDRPVLIGWGQGGVAALGAGLLQAGRVGSVVSVDAPAGHVALLPARALDADHPPPLLLAATNPSGEASLHELQTQLGGRGPTPTTWCCSVNGSPEDQDKAVAERIGLWLEESSGSRARG